MHIFSRPCIVPTRYVWLDRARHKRVTVEPDQWLRFLETRHLTAGFLLLVIIYVILSQGFIKRAIGQYIPQILPSGDQTVSVIGQTIYGCILAVLFGISKLKP